MAIYVKYVALMSLMATTTVTTAFYFPPLPPAFSAQHSFQQNSETETQHITLGQSPRFKTTSA